ncbi:MAG TPA: hypothetical protein ENK85_07680, partial [Saprospiraceae bacterium]|nr:hypothetical protein [Saprospiraceae bacterium]
GPDAQIQVNYAGRGADHHQEIRINNNLITTDEYNGWEARHLTFDIAAADLSSNVNFKMDGLVNADNKVDRSRLSLLTLTYPQAFDFEGQSQYVFSLESTDAQYLVITNFDLSQGIPVLYDTANGQRFEGKINGNSAVFMLPQTSKKRELVLSAGDNGLSFGDIRPVQFIDYASANSDYLMITESRLMDDGNGHNFIQDYADYRASAAGGSYNPLIVNIQQIYDQFGYGVQRNPIGIRNMVQWAVRHWPNARFVYLIGKGRTYNDIRSTDELAEAQATMLVPTFGSPGGDNLLVTSNYDATPRMAIGRLAVTNGDEVRVYLEKVKGLEDNQQQSHEQTIEGQLWKKKVLHLGGGALPGEKIVIKNHLKSMQGVIENSDFCARTVSFFKDVSDPVQQTVPEQIFHEINTGTALITVFGHSSPGSFDYNIDNPDYYDNAGKYPVISSLGCYSGNLFTSQKGISERFCLYDQKGAIGFVASTSVGYISTLGSFGKTYYGALGKQNTIGEGLQEVFKQYVVFGGTSDYRRLSEQMLLNGDPAVQIGLSEGPDYMIDYEQVSFGGATISSRQDSIDLDLTVINLGKNYSDSVSLKITHVLPNGQVYLTKEINFFPQGYATPIHLRWVNPGSSALGQNRLLAEVDYLQELTEWPSPAAELNNKLVSNTGVEGIAFFISDNSTTPIEPREFAIKNKSNITLMASTSNAFADETKYVLQLDTTELFNSPLLETTAITQKGGLIKWQPDINWLDETVYYWRISPDSLSPDLGYLWSGSSFVTTTDTLEGWNQSHFFQFKKDRFDDLEIERDKDLVFGEHGFFLSLKNKVNDANGEPQFVYNLENAASSVRPWNFLNAGLAVFVGDRYTGSGWKNQPGGLYGSINTGNSRVFAYSMDDESDRANLITFLRDIIPDSSYVWVFSVFKDSSQVYHPENWAIDSVNLGVNIFSLLESEGVTKIRSLEDLGSVPYTLMYKKGQGVVKEDIAATRHDVIFTEVFIPVKGSKGRLVSSLIGPSIDWVNMEWDWQYKETDDLDTLNIYGLNQTQTDTVLLFSDVIEQSLSLESVSAQVYPYLMLEYKLQDENRRTAPDLSYWKVHFVPLPEMAINPNVYFQFHSDSIEYGDLLTLDVALENVSAYPMDSLLVNLKIVDNANNTSLFSKKNSPLESYDIDTVHFEIPTTGLSLGLNSLQLEANPNQNQKEYFHGNNFGLKQFVIQGDHQKPVLDVYFDGYRIMDGDLISSKPEIKVELDDENQYFLLTDTSLFVMKLLEPSGQESRIYFSDTKVSFEPATATKNMASIIYHPVFTQDGDYALIISARDVSGNPSGNIDYKIGFKVITMQSVSNVLPYPNPFSTFTRFA